MFLWKKKYCLDTGNYQTEFASKSIALRNVYNFGLSECNRLKLYAIIYMYMSYTILVFLSARVKQLGVLQLKM